MATCLEGLTRETSRTYSLVKLLSTIRGQPGKTGFSKPTPCMSEVAGTVM